MHDTDFSCFTRDFANLSILRVYLRSLNINTGHAELGQANRDAS